MKAAWLDCSCGISGDMCVGALISAGVPFAELHRLLNKMPLRGYGISARRVKKLGLPATKFDVKITRSKTLGPAEMLRVVTRSRLSDSVRAKSLSVLNNIFVAERKAHGGNSGDVHLHELGSADTLVDVVGTVICLELLGIEKLYCSPVNTGSGFADTSHGRLPVPVPATAELLKGADVYSSGIQTELTTPTGAALAISLASGFGPMPPMKLLAVGTGAGEKDLKEAPNVLRVFVGEVSGIPDSRELMVLETNLDDMNPQIYEYVMERLFEAGALDVWLAPVVMKKSRPAVVLGVLCEKDDAARMKEVVFAETTTLGIRCHSVERTSLDRSVRTEKTEFGPVRFKRAAKAGKATGVPEYEDCARIARQTGIPLIEIIRKLSRLR